MSKSQRSTETKCCICLVEHKKAHSLSRHLNKVHKITSEAYTEQYIYNGQRPLCPICKQETRYTNQFSFKTYCQQHARHAMRLAGRVGGKIKKTWNKGQTKATNPTIASQAQKMSGPGNPFFGKTHSQKAKQKMNRRLDFLTVAQRFSQMFTTVSLLSTAVDYNTQYDLLKVQCNVCNTPDEQSWYNLQRCWACRTCHPNASREQVDVGIFIEQLGFKPMISTRKFIYPLELDVYIPERNIAIEYHGLFWHSGGLKDQFTRGRHREKYLACKQNGIKLIQIFGDEWKHKNEICKSMIGNALGINRLKLNARDCTVDLISSRISREFLRETHIAGSVKASIHIGLTHPAHGLVSVLTFRKPRQKKYKGLIEIARLASKLDSTVRGGASKMLKFIENTLKKDYIGILSYADLRYGEGRVYTNCGFKREKDSPVNYWYTDNSVRFDRFKFKANSKLGLSAKQVAEAANVKRIEGCGNAIYIKPF